MYVKPDYLCSTNIETINKFKKLLCSLAESSSLGKGKTPVALIPFKTAEEFIVKTFNLKDMALEDIAVDHWCPQKNLGIGTKTFIITKNQMRSTQKISEHNKELNEIKAITDVNDKIEFIKNSRNNRLIEASRISEIPIENFYYFLIVRRPPHWIEFYVEPMLPIGEIKEESIKQLQTSLEFEDEYEMKYLWYAPKSILSKSFGCNTKKAIRTKYNISKLQIPIWKRNYIFSTLR